jgi:type IV pilus assembly protein PilC
MPTFTYTARNEQGVAQTGQLDAVSEDEVIATLQHRGLLVTSITQRTVEAAGRPLPAKVATLKLPRRMHRRVTVDDQVLLCQQLATLVGAGVPLLKSFEVVASQVESSKLLIALEDVHREVAGGRSFKDALARHPDVFSVMWLNLIETGEASGHLAEALQQLAHHFEMAQHLQNEVRTALTYPLFLCCAALGVLLLFVYWLIPKFAGMFESMGDIEMPLLTQIVLAVSEAARKSWYLIAAGAAGAYWALRQYFRTSVGQWVRDQWLLQLPMFKAFFANVQLAEFSRGLATLLESGVPLLSSLEILERTATNKVYGRAIGVVRSAVREGKTMAEPMVAAGVFPPMTVQMVQVGEEVGELARMVGQIARYYEERVETFIARMTRLFEPIAIVVMGVLVLIIVLSIFMPIFNLAGGGGMKFQ